MISTISLSLKIAHQATVIKSSTSMYKIDYRWREIKVKREGEKKETSQKISIRDQKNLLNCHYEVMH